MFICASISISTTGVNFSSLLYYKLHLGKNLAFDFYASNVTLVHNAHRIADNTSN